MSDTARPAPWADRLAAELGQDPLAVASSGAVLRLARQVAHGSERLNAPLCAYLAGRHVERHLAAGGDEAGALAEVEAAVTRLVAGADAG